MQTLVSLFTNSVKNFSSKPILKIRPKWRLIKWNYKQLENFAHGIALTLKEKNVKQKDNVILISPNSPHWAGSFFGTILNGAVVVPLNPQSSSSFIKKILCETNAKVILKSSTVKLDGYYDVPIINVDQLDDLEKKPHKFKAAASSPEDLVEIVYTSGTTGTPKGVSLTHHNIMSNIVAVSKIFKISSSDRLVSVLPLFHVYAQTAELFMAIKNGVEIMYTSSVSSHAIQNCLQEHRATKMLVVPEILESIIRKIEAQADEKGKRKLLRTMFKIGFHLPYWIRRLLFRKIHKRFGGKLKIVTSGGAALSEEIEQKWNSMGFKILQGYGLTETSPIITTNTLKNHKLGSVGKVIPGCLVKITEKNEILVKGPNVFDGYYKNPEKTKAVFIKERYFKTGDLGYFDKDGFLFIRGRKKYVIVTSSGENVYPEDIEEKLKQCNIVEDATVLGFEEHGRTIIHAILLGNIDDAHSIIKKANDNLASHQQIQDWSIWPESDFPRSATRKVKKEEVIKWLKSRKKEIGSHIERKKISPLVKLLSSVTGKKVSNILDNSYLIQDLHLDSLMRIELISSIEESFNLTIEERLITQKTKVKDLEKLIKKSKKVPKKHKFKKLLFSKPVIFVRNIIIRFLLFPFYALFVKVKTEGIKNLSEKDTPLLFMSNHLSYPDPLLVLRALPSKFRKKLAIAAAFDFMYTKYWYIAWLLEFIFNSYPFPRTEEENIKPGLEITGKILDKGFSILFFAEGKMSTSGKLLPLKKGSGLLATEMDCKVIPVIISGIQELLPQEKVIPRRRGTVTVQFGTPLEFKFGTSYIEATNCIEQAMKDLTKK